MQYALPTFSTIPQIKEWWILYYSHVCIKYRNESPKRWDIGIRDTGIGRQKIFFGDKFVSRYIFAAMTPYVASNNGYKLHTIELSTTSDPPFWDPPFGNGYSGI